MSQRNTEASRPKIGVALVASVIGALAVILAAVIGFGAKHDREICATSLTEKDVEIQRLQEQLQGNGRDGQRQSQLESKITSLQAALDEKEAEIKRLSNGADYSISSAATSPKVGAGTDSKLAGSPRIVEDGGMKVEFHECSLRGDKVTCTFSVTSTTNDRGQYLRRSRLIEQNGNELRASSQQFGSSKSEGRQVYASLARNIPMRVIVAFDAVNAELSRSGFSLIELKFDDLTAQFRDVRL